MRTKSLTFVLTLLLSTPALAASSGPDDVSPPRPERKVAANKKAKKRKARRPIFSGYQVPSSQLSIVPLTRPSGKLTVYSVNLRDTLSVNLYRPDGTFDIESLAALGHFWRCRRTGTERPINPRLLEILSLISDHFDGATIELISGFRNQSRTSSFHFHGSASDIRIRGVNERELHKYVTTLDTGNLGLGLYPRAGFIHVDVRPEASYRWVDYSPPSDDMGHPKKRARRRPTS